MKLLVLTLVAAVGLWRLWIESEPERDAALAWWQQVRCERRVMDEERGAEWR